MGYYTTHNSNINNILWKISVAALFHSTCIYNETYITVYATPHLKNENFNTFYLESALGNPSMMLIVIISIAATINERCYTQPKLGPKIHWSETPTHQKLYFSCWFGANTNKIKVMRYSSILLVSSNSCIVSNQCFQNKFVYYFWIYLAISINFIKR